MVSERVQNCLFLSFRRLPRIESGAGAGIQFFQFVTNSLDSGFHRSDDFSIGKD